MTSLSSQLKQISDKNASVSLDRKSRSRIHSKSLIFDPKIAAVQDFEYLYQIGKEGLNELSTLDSRFKKFNDSLFAESSISLDRNVQSQEMLNLLDVNINAFLVLLGPYYLIQPAIKALEWLVRRLYINVHNGEAMILSCLPYYKYPIFLKILNVIPKNQFPKIFGCFMGFKENLKNPTAASTLKAFYNDAELFRLYSTYILDLLSHRCIYKEQVVFYLSNTVQLIASKNKNLDELNERYMETILEVISSFLGFTSDKSELDCDVKLAAYSIIAVLTSILPLSDKLVMSLSYSIVEDKSKGINGLSRQKLIILGKLWRSYKGSSFEVDILSRIDPKVFTTNDVIGSVIREGYQVTDFLVLFFVSAPLTGDSFRILEDVDLGCTDLYFKAILFKLLEGAFSDKELAIQQELVSAFKRLMHLNKEKFSKTLSEYKDGLDITKLEMLLLHALSEEGYENINGTDLIQESEMNEDKMVDNLSEDDIEDLSNIKSYSTTFLDEDSNEEFDFLISKFSSFAHSTSLRDQKKAISNFSRNVFSNPEVSVTFFLRVSFTPSTPLMTRIMSLKFINRRIKEIADPKNKVDLYLLIPILLLGLYNENESLRLAYSELLNTIKLTSERLHKDKKKVHTRLLMENQMYDKIESSNRAIIAPQDGLFLIETICDDSILQESILDKSRLLDLIFEKIFRAKKSGQKKFGLLILRTFILNQWSSSYLSIAIKRFAWEIMYDEMNKRNPKEERLLFFEKDLKDFFTKRKLYEKELSIYKLSMKRIEKAVVGIVDGSTNEQVDWLLKALDISDNIQVLASNRVIELFESLKLESKIKFVNKFCDMLVDADTDDLVCDPMNTLQSLKFDSETLNSVMEEIQIVTKVPVQNNTKRRRRSSSSARQVMAREDISSMASNHLRKLTIILDVLAFKLMEESSNLVKPELLQILFRILTDLDYLGNDGKLPISYAQETLATCLLETIANLKQNFSGNEMRFDSNYVRADLIVNSIRSSDSPQIQNKLLLVIAELATIAPEIVLHSVMPIFTFIGAHTIRQDNEFSATVIQQTISKVIPSLATNTSFSLKGEIEFLLASFVTAFQHIPRHRRVKLFSSLCKTLKAENSLDVILFLVAQEFSRNFDRGRVKDNESLVEFTNSFLRSFTSQEQLDGISGFLKLWDEIPDESVDTNSEKFSELSKRPIYGTTILSMLNEELIQLKSEILNYLYRIFESSKEGANSSGLKFRIAVLLLDRQVEDREVKSLLLAFKKLTSFLINSLEAYHDKPNMSSIQRALYESLKNILNLLPINYFIDAVIDSFDASKISLPLEIRLAKNLANLIAYKIEEELDPSDLREEVHESISTRLLPLVLNGIKQNFDVGFQQAYLDAFSAIVSTLGRADVHLQDPELVKILISSLGTLSGNCGLLNDKPEIVISAINAIAVIVSRLGVKTIGYYPKIIPPVLSVWKNTLKSNEDSMRLLQTSVILLLSCYAKRLPAFVTPDLEDIITIVILSDLVEPELRTNIQGVIIDHVEESEVMKSLYNLWIKGRLRDASATDLGLYLNALKSCIQQIDKRSAVSQASVFMKWLILSFEFRNYAETRGLFDSNVLYRLENSMQSCAQDFVLKLNDKSFRPIFANVVRWAVYGEGGFSEISKEERLLAFFKFFNRLQEGLKSIFTSYFSYLIEPVTHILKGFINNELENTNLRRILLNSLTGSFKYDQDDYWSQQTRFEAICDPLIGQLQNIEPSIGKYLTKAITSFIINVSSDEYNEILVNSLITYISNENPAANVNSKIWTIRCLKTIFHKLGEQWLSYLPTFIPYIAELLEDDSEEVELEVRNGLVRVIENVLGEPLDRYLS